MPIAVFAMQHTPWFKIIIRKKQNDGKRKHNQNSLLLAESVPTAIDLILADVPALSLIGAGQSQPHAPPSSYREPTYRDLAYI